jgi:hypothetical protein
LADRAFAAPVYGLEGVLLVPVVLFATVDWYGYGVFWPMDNLIEALLSIPQRWLLLAGGLAVGPWVVWLHVRFASYFLAPTRAAALARRVLGGQGGPGRPDGASVRTVRDNPQESCAHASARTFRDDPETLAISQAGISGYRTCYLGQCALHRMEVAQPSACGNGERTWGHRPGVAG